MTRDKVFVPTGGGVTNAAAGRGLPAMQAEMRNMLGDVAISSPFSNLLVFPKIIALSFRSCFGASMSTSPPNRPRSWRYILELHTL